MQTVKNSISLTTEELAAVFALCGFEDIASDVFNSKEIPEDRDVLSDYAENLEVSLKMKGFWDDERESSVPEGLENLITLIAHSKKKVRFVSGPEVLFIHHARMNEAIIQYISEGTHHFHMVSLDEELKSELIDFLHIRTGETLTEHQLDQLLLTEELYNQLHFLSEETHEQILQSDAPASLKSFLKDFKNNQYEFDNLSLLDSSFENKELNVTSVMFYVIENGYVWWLDYNKVEQDEIYILPISIEEFMVAVMDTVNHYLNL
ncbi:hypothetical protein LRR81_17210 [Metabacillus sp. GX 13764]|uniref:hypothetical protein n=1 Tax=Metabacillus kandeliae TaxID=2900151 RepID=UPI001E39B9DB|nr:hypothetical protein [Metabacillus kandeliae]MCD7035985.1 hypothetical protein [Metabacillus kandeliae]